MQIQFKKLSEDAVIPQYAHPSDAGIDLVATRFTQEVDEAGKVVLVYHTDLACKLPENTVGLLCMRSSVSKKSLSLCNAVGILDEGYTGEIIFKFKLTTDAVPSIYKPFEKVGQLVVVPKLALDIVEVDELPITDRGTGGFGSTDEQPTINENSSSTDYNQQIRA